MRVVHLGESRSGGFMLRLHPNLTVVQGLAGARREWLLQSLVALANGRMPDADGVVEAHGMLLDVEARSLRTVLGLGDEVIDPIVRSGDLPGDGHSAALVAGRRRHAEHMLQALRERLEASEGAVAEARRRCESAGRRLAQAPTPVQTAAPDADPAGVELATRKEAVRSAQVAATEARRRLEALLTDPGVSDRLSLGRARRVAATKALSAAMAELEGAGADLDGDAERLLQEAHRSVLQLQKGLDAGKPDPVRSEELRLMRVEARDLALRLVRHRSATGRISQLEASFPALQAEERAAMEQVTRVRTEHTCNQAELRGRLRAADAELKAANLALAALESPAGEGADAAATPDPVRVQMERRRLVARIDLGGASAASEVLRSELAAQQRRLLGEADQAPPAGKEENRRTQAEAEADEDARRKELEWYLLSRLALQRSVGVAGSVPLVLDNAFARLPPGVGPSLLAWLERLASSVQIVVLSDDPQIAAWIGDLGGDRGAEVDVNGGTAG